MKTPKRAIRLIDELKREIDFFLRSCTQQEIKESFSDMAKASDKAKKFLEKER